MSYQMPNADQQTRLVNLRDYSFGHSGRQQSRQAQKNAKEQFTILYVRINLHPKAMKFILKTFIVAPLLAFVLASEKESPVRRLRRKLQVAAKNFGRNHSGNLGLCEGDCNTNAECRGDLVCLQRDAGDSAPGCNLSSSQRNSRVDFCVARGGASNPPSPVAAPVRAPPTSSGRSFALKLYWEKGKEQ